MSSSVPPLNGCTIVSKNYLAYARVLARSFLEHHPGGRFFTLMVDRADDYFDPAAEDFELLQVEDLKNIPDVTSLLFQYTVLEANTAVKPFFLQHLMEQEGLERLVYLDPDILVVRQFDLLSERLETESILLTPHLTGPIDDTAFPGETDILRVGAYNLGFIALADRPPVRDLLRWWQVRVADRCVVRLADGLFVDQKWMDLVPGFHPEVGIVHHPGYNVAYWNLHTRRLEMGDPIRVNGEPLCFFHFSGVELDYPEKISRHQNRFTLADRPELRPLFDRYVSLIREAGFGTTRHWPYAYATFDNSVPIPDVVRAFYLSLDSAPTRFGDPFATARENSFWRWMNGRATRRRPPCLSRLLFYLWEADPDVQLAFSDPSGDDLDAFAEWLNVHGTRQYRLSPELLMTLEPLLMPSSGSLGARQRAKRVVKQLYMSKAAWYAKKAVKRVFGRDFARRLKRRVRPLATGQDTPTVVAGPMKRDIDLSRLGVNVVGYVSTESGMGQGARALLQAVEAAGLPYSVTTLDLDVRSRMEDSSVGDSSSDLDYGINLCVFNADQTPAIVEHLGRSRFGGHYNVGVWVWEQERFPDAWLGAFDHFDEIWTPSGFSVDALSAVSPVPVRRMPHVVEVPRTAGVDRATFDLPEDVFVFLFVFDFLSYAARKNPLGAVRAFTQAFGQDERAVLVLKCTSSDFEPEAFAAVQAEIAGSQVRLIDKSFSRREVYDLIGACDAYVSLHRSEGFGLTLAEAMALGKPVIATQYSGNTDFMTPTNSLPVGYRVVTLERDAGPYVKGSHWAEPDLDHAAELMRKVYDDRELGRRIGDRAREDIDAGFSRKAIGSRLREYVSDIVRRHPGGPGLTHPGR